MRTSSHYQPEAQHPNSSAIHKLPADYPIFWHLASIPSVAEIRTLLEVKRTFGDAATCVGPTRMTLSRHGVGRYPALQRTPNLMHLNALCSREFPA
jgi:hypothetical protein